MLSTYNEGIITISVTYLGLLGTTSATVNPPSVTEINIYQNTPGDIFVGLGDVWIGQQIQLHARAKFSNDTYQDITNVCSWSSTYGRASVSNTGLVTMISAGFEVVSASYGGQQESILMTIN